MNNPDQVQVRAIEGEQVTVLERSVKTADGKIVITRVGTRRTLSGFE